MHRAACRYVGYMWNSRPFRVAPVRALGQVSNIDVMAFETSCNIATNTRAWNKRTQGWLERYVYMRTGEADVHF